MAGLQRKYTKNVDGEKRRKTGKQKAAFSSNPGKKSGKTKYMNTKSLFFSPLLNSTFFFFVAELSKASEYEKRQRNGNPKRHLISSA